MNALTYLLTLIDCTVGTRQKESYLIALTSLMKSVPHSTYIHEMPKVRIASVAPPGPSVERGP